MSSKCPVLSVVFNVSMCMRGTLNWMCGCCKEAYMRYEYAEHIWAKEGEQQINLQNYKIQKVTWLTELTCNQNNPSCKLLKLFLAKFQHFLNLGNFWIIWT